MGDDKRMGIYTIIFDSAPFHSVIMDTANITPVNVGCRESAHVLYTYRRETIKTDIESSHIFGSNVYANLFLRVR